MAKAAFLSGYINIGGTVLRVTNLDFNETFQEIDVTDLTTVLGKSDSVAVKGKSTFSAEGFHDLTVDLPVRGTEISVYLAFQTYNLSGNGIILSATVNAVFDTAIRFAITGTFVDTVTEGSP